MVGIWDVLVITTICWLECRLYVGYAPGQFRVGITQPDDISVAPLSCQLLAAAPHTGGNLDQSQAGLLAGSEEESHSGG